MSEPRDVTPKSYSEGPFMVKHGGHYYLMYSAGKTIEENYRVHYAIGSSPLGPFTVASNSRILVSDAERNILSPGHHAVFSHEGRSYIAYHRHSVPFLPDPVRRQVCVDEMRFTADGLIDKVATSHEGAPAKDSKGAWLQIDLGRVKEVKRNSLRFEYAWKPYRFTLQSSLDGLNWNTVDHVEGVSGSPIEISKPVAARYLRLTFPADVKGESRYSSGRYSDRREQSRPQRSLHYLFGIRIRSHRVRQPRRP